MYTPTLAQARALVGSARFVPMYREILAGQKNAAVLLGAMAGVDERDEATRASRGKAAGDYTKFLDPEGLRGARIGVVGRTGRRPPARSEPAPRRC